MLLKPIDQKPAEKIRKNHAIHSLPCRHATYFQRRYDIVCLRSSRAADLRSEYLLRKCPTNEALIAVFVEFVKTFCGTLI